MNRLAVINTGGTISCVGNPLAPMSAKAFAAACTTIVNPMVLQQFPAVEITYVVDLSFPESSSGTLDSTNLQPTDWCLIAQYILSHYADYDGWVVLHGTDSMDFTGTALPFLLSVFDSQGIPTAVLSKPIILTGSQVPLFFQSAPNQPLALNFNTDALQNFCGALAYALADIPEVCVYFDSALYRGNRVLKTNASQFNAFSSPNYPSLGTYGIRLSVDADALLPGPVSTCVSLDNPSVLQNVAAQLTAITAAINSVPVVQLSAFPAWYNTSNSTGLLASLISAYVAQGIKGLILESYGEGNFPSGNPDNPAAGATYKALSSATTGGVVIVDCTQVISGTVNDSAYAAGAWLPAVGALDPADMSPMAALAKLTVLLAAAHYNGWTVAQVKTLMQLNLLGEMSDVSRLDSRGAARLLAGQALTAIDGSAQFINDIALGPQLRSASGTVLWSALPSIPANESPGALIMQNDGNLVLYSRNNTPLWATNTGISTGASSMLMLNGSLADKSLFLSVYNYSARVTSATLYSSSQS